MHAWAKYVAAFLYVLSYLAAVVDGAAQPPDGSYLSGSTEPRGLRDYVRQHPLIGVGAVSGVLGTVVGLLL